MDARASARDRQCRLWGRRLLRDVTVLEQLKADPRDVLFTAIVGDPTPFEVEERAPPGSSTPIAALAHSCSYAGASGQEVADPAARLAHFARAAARRGRERVQCQPPAGARGDGPARQGARR